MLCTVLHPDSECRILFLLLSMQYTWLYTGKLTNFIHGLCLLKTGFLCREDKGKPADLPRTAAMPSTFHLFLLILMHVLPGRVFLSSLCR